MTAISGLESIANPANMMNFRASDVVTLLGKVQPELRISQLSVHQQFVSGKISSAHVTNSLSCMLLNTAYESVKHLNNQSPEFEFFRHARNAASHGNRFDFTSNQPIRPASWRGLHIDHEVKGKSNPLQGQVCLGNIISGSDVIVLLWDIEKQLLANTAD